MEITLEKIELVRDRTGVSYKEAKEALEAADGSVVDAIVAIEETVDGGVTRSTIEKKDALVNKIKEVVEKGNVSRIKVTKEDDTIINLPLSAGILGTLIAPWAAIAGAVAAFGFKCKIEFVKDDGSVVDITEKATEAYDNAKEKGQDIYFDIKERAPESFDDLRTKGEEAFNKAKGKGESVFGKAKDAVTNSVDKFKEGMKGVKEDFEEFDFEEDVVEEVKEAVDEVVDEVKDEE
ncbi:MAG: DUF4342 domain-containing protein [Firmicutes bacterium]|nr:DUF4342 domain-containing protein [Bacillota bacterium]